MFASSTILFLIFDSHLAEAHNIRVGQKEQHAVVTRTTPSDGSRDPPSRSGTHHVPPRVGPKVEYSKALVPERHGPGLAYGEPCTNDDMTQPNDQCESGWCTSIGPPDNNEYVCADCNSHEDCVDNPEGSRCIFELESMMYTSAVAPYCATPGQYGDPCTMNEDCESNHCNGFHVEMDYIMQCGECSMDDDCPDEKPWCINTNSAPSTCRPEFEEPCNSQNDGDTECAECIGSSDCIDSNKPRCVYDLTGTSFCAPLAVLGEICTMPEDCDTGICEFKPDLMSQICSECTSDYECQGNPNGTLCLQVPSGANTCAPPAELGDTCFYPSDCESGRCSPVYSDLHMICVGCDATNDCVGHPDGPHCVYDPESRAPPVCGPLGAPGAYCIEPEDCASDHCLFYEEGYDGICG